MDLQKLKQEQEMLASKVLITDQFDEIKTIGACDQAYVGDKILSVAVVLDAKTLEVIEKKYAILDCKFPYIVGYLSYREAPVLIEAVNKLSTKPDVLLIDGNGILHPRRIGLASHAGIALDIPTIGVAKSLLLGENSDGNIIVDKEIRAVEFISREHARPLYVSPGHKVCMKSSLEFVKNSMKYPHKLPEPLHVAHRLATKLRQKEEAKLNKENITHNSQENVEVIQTENNSQEVEVEVAV